jgi:hypothetical protein
LIVGALAPAFAHEGFYFLDQIHSVDAQKFPIH